VIRLCRNVESTVTIDRPVEEVFRFFLDLDTNARKTDPNIDSIIKTPEGPTRAGTTFHVRQRALGRIRETTSTFTSIESNRKIEMEARLGPLRPKGAITFQQTIVGTTVAVRLNPNPVGPLKLLSPVFGRIGQTVWDRRLARLKAALESQEHIDSDAEKRKLSPTRTIALAGIIGPIWFTTFVVLQGLLLPDYSHVRLPISALAAWPTGWIQNINFYVTGALLMAFALALHHDVQPTRRGGAGVALLVLGAVGVVWVGIFPWRMVDGVPTEPAAHVIGAVMAFAATGIGLIVFSRRMIADPRWRDLATYTMATGIAVVVLFVAVGFFAIDDGAPLHARAGLLQRALCAVWFTCLIVLALRLRTV
jgi:hypothetical membrane protein/uncharacterized membrane protein